MLCLRERRLLPSSLLLKHHLFTETLGLQPTTGFSKIRPFTQRTDICIKVFAFLCSINSVQHPVYLLPLSSTAHMIMASSFFKFPPPLYHRSIRLIELTRYQLPSFHLRRQNNVVHNTLCNNDKTTVIVCFQLYCTVTEQERSA